MATAVGTPVIGLYAATNLQRACPYLSPQWCIDRYAACAQKFLNQSASELRWGTKLEFPGVMDSIEVRDVTEKLDAFIQQF
jgi:heptosyltransferase I